MTSDSKDIEHRGVVKEIAKNTIKINLLNVAACSSCHAKGACSVSEVDNKEIEVIDQPGQYKPGDQVHVLFQKSLGPKALALGYLFPFVVVFSSLLIAWHLTSDELMSGLISLGTLIPYYAVLALFRDKLKSTFTFKINHSKTLV